MPPLLAKIRHQIALRSKRIFLHKRLNHLFTQNFQVFASLSQYTLYCLQVDPDFSHVLCLIILCLLASIFFVPASLILNSVTQLQVYRSPILTVDYSWLSNVEWPCMKSMLDNAAHSAQWHYIWPSEIVACQLLFLLIWSQRCWCKPAMLLEKNSNVFWCYDHKHVEKIIRHISACVSQYTRIQSDLGEGPLIVFLYLQIQMTLFLSPN